jgi:hypothetical protein
MRQNKKEVLLFLLQVVAALRSLPNRALVITAVFVLIVSSIGATGTSEKLPRSEFER